MKYFLFALLATTTVVATAPAKAENLSDLKAQIESLNARIMQLEAAPAVPTGYELLSVTQAPAINAPSLAIDKSFAKTATTIAVMPTADMPDGPNVQWTGYARAAVVRSNHEYGEELQVPLTGATVVGTPVSVEAKDTDVFARGQLKVVGTTDTAVGEVGAQLQLRGTFDGIGNANVQMNQAWGWWKMLPEITIGGGFSESLANIGHGYDGACNCYYTDNAPVALNPGDTTQLRLTYSSGPISASVALEDHDGDYATREVSNAVDDSLGATGEVKFSGDTFSAEVSAGYWTRGHDSAVSITNEQSGVAGWFADDLALAVPVGATASDLVSATSAYQVGAGLSFSFNPVNVSLAAGMGRNHTGNKYWGASALASADLADTVHAEIAYGYATGDGFASRQLGGATTQYVGGYDYNTHAVLGGVYYDPVSQLTLGIEGEWFRTSGSGNDDHATTTDGILDAYSFESTDWQADFVSVYRF